MHAMPIGITDDHEELRRTVRRFLEQYCSPAVVRAAADAPHETPEFWSALGGLGWTGLHVAESHGGSGYGLVELGVVLEEFGRACAPGPFLSTVTAAAILGRADSDHHDTLAAIAAGTAVAFAPNGLDADVLSGRDDRATFVIGDDCILVAAGGIECTTGDAVDVVRGSARVADAAAGTAVSIAADRARAIAVVVAAAEAVGIAQWCVDTAAQYAQDRVQFGRPIGQFQGVKHRCADMLARTELARAAVWDALRAVDDLDNGADVAIAAAAALAIDGAYECAKDCVQVLGGIGFTWEHDAHFYLRRAMALRATFGTSHRWKVAAARAASGGVRRRLAVDLGPDADALRAELRPFLDEVSGLDPVAQRARLAAEGYISPAWPRPWGRDAAALELLVIEEEFRAAKVNRPNIAVGQWALPNVIVYGTPEQQERWIMPTLDGSITWCQLFSEPGAGSDLASLTTKAERTDGGWRVTGQKVWTSMAQTADWGILLARTDQDAVKHEGISCFMVDMRTPGIDIRPLRELTGHAMFNEVFFDDVFVPDDCLIGVEHDGWKCARTTLANERVFMGGSSTVGGAVVGVLRLLEASGLADDAYALDTAGSLVVTGHALAVLGFRLTLSALGGADPSGSEAAVRKLLGVQQEQRVQEVGVELCGPAATRADGTAQGWIATFMFNRCLSIAGGTTEIQKNVIAERLLGLPRD